MRFLPYFHIMTEWNSSETQKEDIIITICNCHSSYSIQPIETVETVKRYATYKVQ